jgi:hypothetical protein
MHRRKLLDDPLVPISGTWLDAALQDRGISRREAARQLNRQGINETPQTLDNIAAGKQRKCRATLRAALAELTGLSEKFLAGGLRTWSSDRMLHFQVSDGLPRVYLARERVRRMITRAWRRDLERGLGLIPTYKGRVEDQSDESFRQYVELAVDRLLSVWWWRQLLLEDGGGWRVSPGDAERFAIGLAGALEVLLAQWFNDRSALDFEAFGQLLSAITNAKPRSVGVKELGRHTATSSKEGGRPVRQLRMLASLERDILRGFQLRPPKKH